MTSGVGWSEDDLDALDDFLAQTQRDPTETNQHTPQDPVPVSKPPSQSPPRPTPQHTTTSTSSAVSSPSTSSATTVVSCTATSTPRLASPYWQHLPDGSDPADVEDKKPAAPSAARSSPSGFSVEKATAKARGSASSRSPPTEASKGVIGSKKVITAARTGPPVSPCSKSRSSGLQISPKSKGHTPPKMRQTTLQCLVPPAPTSPPCKTENSNENSPESTACGKRAPPTTVSLVLSEKPFAPKRNRTVHEVISCSSRTDIAAFHTPWLMNVIAQAVHHNALLSVPNPFTHGSTFTTVDLSPKIVRAWVCWSKNYRPFLEAIAPGKPGAELVDKYDAWLFQFTINGPADTELEPGLHSTWEDRMDQVHLLAQRFGPEAVLLRFDPVVRYRHHRTSPDEPNEVHCNLEGDWFEKLCQVAGKERIPYISVGFVTTYKTAVRCMLQSGLEFVPHTKEEVHANIEHMVEIARLYGVQIRGCSDSAVCGIEGVSSTSCINATYIDTILSKRGKKPLSSKSRAHKQSARPGCRCTDFIDIGSYNQQKCGHKCLYCYARHGPKSTDIEDCGLPATPTANTTKVTPSKKD
ncbi:DUF1848 family protein [Pelomyxa schiedti]|nr:DUF1848 family protein [Pelomyxa schiedti]